jgi:PTH1 family peptidyl-tRNA hydrolase
MIDLIVGLGNPGTKYTRTRHNIGQRFLEERFGHSSFQTKFKGQYAKIELAGKSLYALIPHTFMNLSGESVLACCQFFKISPSNILVIHDELDLDFGRIQLRMGGGLAGHNGLKSMASCLNTQDFYRLRVGIARPPVGDVASWVLSDFSGDEEIQLGAVYDWCHQALNSLLTNGLKQSMDQYNKKIFNN